MLQSRALFIKEEVRAARQIPRVPLLQKCGLQLVEKEAGNFELTAFPDLLVIEVIGAGREATWLANAIDFFMRVLDHSFHVAMLYAVTKLFESTIACIESPPDGSDAAYRQRFPHGQGSMDFNSERDFHAMCVIFTRCASNLQFAETQRGAICRVLSENARWHRRCLLLFDES